MIQYTDQPNYLGFNIEYKSLCFPTRSGALSPGLVPETGLSASPTFHLTYYVCSYTLPSCYTQLETDIRVFFSSLLLVLPPSQTHQHCSSGGLVRAMGEAGPVAVGGCAPLGSPGWGLWVVLSPAQPGARNLLNTPLPPCHPQSLKLLLKEVGWGSKVNSVSKCDLFSLQQKRQLFLCMTNLFL